MNTYQPKGTHEFKQVICLLLLAAVLWSSPSISAPHLLCSKATIENSKNNYFDRFTVSSSLSKLDLMTDEIPALFTTNIKNDVADKTQVCVFPANHPATEELLQSMGVSQADFLNLLSRAQHAQQRVTLVHTDAEMLNCVSAAYPSVGYVSHALASEEFDCY